MSAALPEGQHVVRETMTRVPRQTVEDFEALPEGTLAQLIDGEIIMSPSPTYRHQRVILRLVRLLADYADEHGGEVVLSPMDVYLTERNVFQPDILFISDQRAGIIRERVHGAPDLVVEVLSPSTGYYDLTKKRDTYLAEGVREYWLIDPERETVGIEVSSAGAFESVAHAHGAGSVESVVLPGFRVDVGALFADR